MSIDFQDDYATIQTRRVWFAGNDHSGGIDLPGRSPCDDADQGNLAARADLLQIPRTNPSDTQERRIAAQQNGRRRWILSCPFFRRDHPWADLPCARWTCGSDQVREPDGV